MGKFTDEAIGTGLQIRVNIKRGDDGREKQEDGKEAAKMTRYY